MKILYLVPPAESESGISAYSFITEELEALREQGHELVVISPKQNQIYSESGYLKLPVPPKTLVGSLETLWLVARTLPISLPLLFRDARRFLGRLRIERFASKVAHEQNVDLIHSHFAWPGGLGGVFVKRTTGLPLITSLRGMEVLVDENIGYGGRNNVFFDKALKTLLREADQIICVSDFIRNLAVELGAPAARTKTILKGVHLERFAAVMPSSVARERLGLKEKFTVLSVGGLILRKGMDTILRALATVGGDFQFVVCGTGPELENLRALATHLKIQNNVFFTGQIGRQEIPLYFLAADVFVLASRHEASGNVLCEALATGRPVITTNSGGPPEYVTHGRTGYIVEPEDVAGMAERIEWLMCNPDSVTQLGEAGCKDAELRFAYSRMIADITAVYRQALNMAPNLR